MDWLTLPLQFPVMQQAAAIAAIIAVPAGLLSCFLVLKGWSLMGDAVSHAVLPGVVGAYVLGLPLIAGAFVAGMICALTAGFLQDNSRVKADTVLGVVMSGMFALGLVIYTAISSDVHLDHILFGNILGVDRAELATTVAISVLVAGWIALRWKDLAMHAFDPVQARVAGLRGPVLHYGLMVALTLVVVAMLSAVGIILAVALLIAPGAIAFLLVRRMGTMLIVAVGAALIAGQTGLIASFWLDAAPAPTIVLVLTIQFVAAFLWRTLRDRRGSLDLDGPAA